MSNCPVCCAKIEAREVEHVGEYTLYHCPACDVVFSDPMRAATREWYEKYHQESLSLPALSTLNWNERQFFKSLPRLKGRLLELGCGRGSFLARAQKAGYDVFGIDFSDLAVERAREEFGLHCVEAVSFEDFFNRPIVASYDVCVFFEVLEHQENPNRFLQGLRQLLRPDGRIVLSVPNRARKPNIPLACDYPPYHLTRWSPKALHSILARNGFRVISLTDRGFQIIDLIHPYLSLGVIYRLLTRASSLPVQSKGRHSILKTALLLGSFKYGLLRLIALPINLAGNLLGAKGQTLFAVAQAEISGKPNRNNGKSDS